LALKQFYLFSLAHGFRFLLAHSLQSKQLLIVQLIVASTIALV